MKKKQLEMLFYSLTGVAVMLVIVIAVNVIASLAKARVDLTSEKLYTLSPGTRAILAKLDTPIKLRFYCSRAGNALPVFLKNYAQRVEDLLAEYRQAGKGMIEVEKLDPQPDSDAEDSARLDGVDGQSVNMEDRIYLGLSVTCLDAKVAIPFLAPERERLLEYEISRAISRAVRPEKPIIGVMSSLPVFGVSMNMNYMPPGQQPRSQAPWTFINELKNDFDVRQVEPTVEQIDESIKVLVAICPKDISEKTQFALDQFILRGGKLIAFLDPLPIAEKSAPFQRPPGSGATLGKLLKAWGIEFDPQKVVADMNLVTQLNRGGGTETVPSVLSLTSKSINTDDVVTSQVDNVLLAFAGVFTGTPMKGLKQTVLLKTTTESQLVAAMMAEMSSERTIRDFVSSGKEYTLALRLTGKFNTAFPEGNPGDKTKPAVKESAAPATVVLVGDSDLLFDPLCVQVHNIFGQKILQPLNGNLSFAQSLVEQMAGDNNLIGVRSRATMNRPFIVVKQMQAMAEANYRTKIKELEESLSTTRQRLGELEKNKQQGQRFILSPEQQAEITRFRQQETQVKLELKQVRKDLRRDIDSLENRLKWLNITVMPLCVVVLGLALANYKRKKTK
ncbi:MAG: Gldg family protein [Verrucomicrobia bacterium]|nr:Gldg family protein [Verrucomicrobiota bacterium]